MELNLGPGAQVPHFIHFKCQRQTRGPVSRRWRIASGSLKPDLCFNAAVSAGQCSWIRRWPESEWLRTCLAAGCSSPHVMNDGPSRGSVIQSVSLVELPPSVQSQAFEEPQHRVCQCSTATQAMFHVKNLFKISELDSLKRPVS